MKIYPNELSFLLQSRVPSELWLAIGILLCIGLACIFRMKKSKEQKWRYIGVLCLAIYVFIVLCNTVIFRTDSHTSRVLLIPFWSYVEAVKESRSFYLIENLLNIILFVPIGLFLKMTFRNIKFIQILLCGLLFSLTIEISQLILYRGWFEVDDLMQNTLGAILGYFIFKILNLCMIKIYDQFRHSANSE